MSHPEAHLAKSSTQDASASFVNLAMHDYDISTSMHHKCVLSVPKQNWYATEEEFADLALRYGCEQDQFSIRCFAVAHVFAVHFRAKEWLKYPRCGSVVTWSSLHFTSWRRVIQTGSWNQDPGAGNVKVTLSDVFYGNYKWIYLRQERYKPLGNCRNCRKPRGLIRSVRVSRQAKCNGRRGFPLCSLAIVV